MDTSGNPKAVIQGKIFTNLYQVNIAYPFDATKSIGLSTGIRSDRVVYLTDGNYTRYILPSSIKTLYSVTHFEYVYDNSLNPSHEYLERVKV